ncbi:cupin [Cupriavidus basilensis OR16]|uniref:Cupin n=1 Tax=Cupriavidus basilensis OR16 TaxID=1127483 RepID=H1SIM8_9BURK|nr:cupin domain-containing protein [Cupriavidus basilensis]EHP37621.1 cupin [Cupriavidus basilensis OR16]
MTRLQIGRAVSRLAIATAVPALLALLGAGNVHAHTPDGQPGRAEETVQPLMKQPIPEAAGKNVLLATVTLAPGQASAPHVHPGSIFAYVLEGTVVSQLGGEPAKTYGKGQSWYEAPNARHLVTRNASKTTPARLLVFAIAGEGEPIKLPLPQ